MVAPRHVAAGRFLAAEIDGLDPRWSALPPPCRTPRFMTVPWHSVGHTPLAGHPLVAHLNRTPMTVEPFQIQISDAAVDELRARLARTRFVDEVSGADWDYGTNLSYLRELIAYFAEQFDWRAQERRLGRLAHFRADVDGHGLHFVHARGRGPAPLPLLLTHGWPDSFLRMEKLIPLLADPAAHGGDEADAFDVVVPSMPGFGFSDRPREPGMTPAKIASLFGKLMTDELGYARYGAHGGDWGSVVTEQLAVQSPATLIGIHLTDVPFGRLFQIPPSTQLSAAEQQYLKAAKQWQATEGAYNAVQSTKPQSLAYALNDSPVGLTAWLVEKFRSWSDCQGDLETRFSKDELLTNVCLYWFTQTIGSACRLYYEAKHARAASHGTGRIEVPTGFAIFPKDLLCAPRELGERWFNVARWSTMPRGGHFAAFEEPALLVQELRAFYRPLRTGLGA
jgi:pimeloyl-ACP methyl ester carboxylesterase